MYMYMYTYLFKLFRKSKNWKKIIQNSFSLKEITQMYMQINHSAENKEGVKPGE